MVYEEKERLNNTPQNLVLEDRARLSVTGVLDVDSFDEEAVLLVTELGYITLHGMDLHISKLSLEEGQLVVEGEITGVEYSDHEGIGKDGGFFKKLFK